MIKILDRGQHGRTLCLSLGKPTIAPSLCRIGFRFLHKSCRCGCYLSFSFGL